MDKKQNLKGTDQQSESKDASSAIVGVEAQDLTVKQKAGDAANRWMARNRSLVLRQTPIWAQSLAVLMICLGSISVLVGIFVRIDEVVSVSGQLKSIGGTVEVETPAGGQISAVLFKDGQSISKGQLLVRFDTREAEERKRTLTSMIEIQAKQLENQIQSINSQRISMIGREEVLKQRLMTKETITQEMNKLVEQGGFQRLQYLEQLDQVYEMKKQISELSEQQIRLDLQSDQIRLDSIRTIDQLKASLMQTDLQLQYQTVKAPVSGIIFDPAVRLEGVLKPGERILSIVPQKGLYAEIYVPNQDIGFVKTGQEAKVRVDAFPYSRYGEVTAKVNQISADALPPDTNNSFYRFPVKLEMNKSFLESRGVKIPLMPGMAVTTNLKLREKRVISLLSDLLVDQTDSIRSIRQQ